MTHRNHQVVIPKKQLVEALPVLVEVTVRAASLNRSAAAAIQVSLLRLNRVVLAPVTREPTRAVPQALTRGAARSLSPALPAPIALLSAQIAIIGGIPSVSRFYFPFIFLSYKTFF